MSPLMMLLALMLPLLTTATQVLNASDLNTLFPPNPVGDVLNVTQCYCQSPNPLAPDAMFGYHYLFNYWNYHLSRTYAISVNCTSSAPGNFNRTEPAKCMDHISKNKKLCLDYSDGNEFCYKFKEDMDNAAHSKPSGSKYYFNDQHRDVPAQVSDMLTPDDVTQDCGRYCGEELEGLLTAQTPELLIPGVGTVVNSVVSYTDLDDMCSTCE